MSRSPSSVIRRARFTYARTRDLPDLDISFDGGNTSIDSREDPSSSTSLNLDDEPPPSSDDRDAFNTSGHASDGDDDSPQDGPPSFQFSWRDHLKKIDDGDFDSKGLNSAPSSYDESFDNRRIHPATPSDPDQLMTDVLSGSLPSLPGSLPAPSSRRAESLVPSDSESFREDHPSTPQTSPRHTISTPQSRSSPTPPTSIEAPQMPPKKGKGKARDVQPLRFEGDDQPVQPSKTEKAKQQRRKSATASRVKQPTKKEDQERQKVTARLHADRLVSIERADENRYNLTYFQHRYIAGSSRAKSRTPPIPSDPIMDFSSDRPDLPEQDPPSRRGSLSKPVPNKDADAFVLTGLLGDVSSDEEQFPDLSELLRKDDGRQKESERKRLHEIKLQLAAQHQTPENNDDESDLEIVEDDMKSVARDEVQLRRGMAARGDQPSRGRQRQLALAGVGARRQSTTRLPLDEVQAQHVLRNASAPFAASTGKAKDKSQKPTREELSRFLLQSATMHSKESVRKKEDDWLQRGGTIKVQPAQIAPEHDVTAQLNKFKETRKAAQASRAVDEVHDSDSDYDWEPDGGESDREVNEDEDGEPSDGDVGHESLSHVDADDQADDEADDDNPLDVPRPRRTTRRPVTTVESDDEGAENRLPSQMARNRVLVRDSSFARVSESLPDDGVDHGSLLERNSSSLGERTDGTRTEDGTDKENDIRLSFDRGDDKENTVIAIQSPSVGIPLLGSRGFGKLFGAEMQASPSGSVGRGGFDGIRSPLKEISAEDDDDPFVDSPQPALRLGRLGGVGSLEASPMNLGEGSGLQPAFSLKGKERARSISPSPIGEPLRLGAGLGGGGFSQFFTQEENARGFEQLKAAQENDDISLTLDAGLQPTLEVSRTFRKKADDIFEKEQEMIAQEEQANAVKEAEPEVFVDANGFLTQTRPQFISPLRTRSSSRSLQFSSPNNTLVSLSSGRKPLASLDFDLDDVPSSVPRKRLLRRDRSGSPEPMVAAARKVKNKDNGLGQAQKSKKIVRSEFVVGEAEESDDERRMGFGEVKRRDDEEEENGEDQDQPLAELVDDRPMDEKTLAVDAVLEKVREQEEKDDKANEKLQIDVVQGKHRQKRRGGPLGISDDDSSDDEGTSKVRGPAKRQRRDNDSIAALKKDPSTRAFADEYHGELDDDDEFASLRKDVMDVDQDEESAEEEERRVVDTDVLRKQLMEAARKADAFESFDAHDVSYVDDEEDEMEMEFGVREVSREAAASRRPNMGDTVVQPKGSFNMNDTHHANMAKWAKNETSSRTVGITGRNTGGSAAVTGHGKTKAGGGSFKAARGAPSSSGTAAKGTKIGKGPSLLSAVPSRRGKFGN